MDSPRVGVVLPGVALHSWVDGDPLGQPVDVIPPPVVVPAELVLPDPRVGDEPAIMPLPARVVLYFADGSRQVVTPLSDEAERMRATAERLMGVSPSTARPVHQARV